MRRGLAARVPRGSPQRVFVPRLQALQLSGDFFPTRTALTRLFERNGAIWTVAHEENDWVRRARAGDRAAFAALVDRYWERLRRWLFGWTGRAHLAEELTQEAFFRAWRGLGQIQADATFRVWLFRIARNCLIDARRGPRGRAIVPLPGILEDKEPGPVDRLLETEAQQRLRTALGRLPRRYRAAFLLCTQEGWPYSQIAQALEVSEETARWRVHKARQFLLKELEAYLDVPKS